MYKLHRVISGDTVELTYSRTVAFRLAGICAPDMDTRAGMESKMNLESLLGSREITLHAGRVYLGDLDVSEWMIKEGHAVAK